MSKPTGLVMPKGVSTATPKPPPKQPPKPTTPPQGVTLQTYSIAVTSDEQLHPTPPNNAPLYTTPLANVVGMVKGIGGTKLMQLTLHGSRGKLRVYNTQPMQTYTAQLKAGVRLTQAVRELITLAYPTVTLSKADISVQAIIGSLAKQGVFHGHELVVFSLAHTKRN